MAFLRKYKRWLIALVVLLILWALMRSCSKETNHSKRNLYVIARDSTWYPLDMMGKEKNLLAFSDDLMAAIAKNSEMRFDLIDTGPDSLIEGLDNGNFDAVFSFMSPNVINREKYIFSNIIIELGPVLVMRSNAPLMSLADMEGKTIGVQASSLKTYTAITNSINPSLKYIVVPYISTTRALEALDANLIDAVILDAMPAYTYTEGFYGGRLKVVSAPLGDEGLRLVGKKGRSSEKLITKFNESLKELQEKGTLDALLNKWNLIDPQKRYLGLCPNKTPLKGTYALKNPIPLAIT